MSHSLSGAGRAVSADLKAGILISLIALPLCLGIAAASGFPPISGLITAIVGGCLVSFLGSARYTIKGPAAGLIVIVLGAVNELGGGDLVAGYHRALAVGVVAGVLQLILARLRTAGLGISMSKSVVHGMLAAIGIIIVAKQIHVLLGVTPHAHETFGLIAEIPHSIGGANIAVAFVGVVSLVLLVLWPWLTRGPLRHIPAQLVVVIVAGLTANGLGFGADEPVQLFGLTAYVPAKALVDLPENLIAGIALPDFSMIFTFASFKYVIMFALVGMIESTLSVVAIDAIASAQKPANLNKDFTATSIGNIISACIGGLPMISEIVRSKANVDAGAKSVLANFFHGACLLVFVVALPGLVECIPLSALAAMLVIVGLRLASVRELLHVKEIGKDQLALFMTTLFVTLLTDLLLGVAAGLLLKIVIHLVRGATLKSLFAPKIETVLNGNTATLQVVGEAAFPCLLKVKSQLAHLPNNIKSVVIDVSKSRVIDHTFQSGFDLLFAELPQVKSSIHGIERFTAVSPHDHATRLRG